jgi:hypothetical protein
MPSWAFSILRRNAETMTPGPRRSDPVGNTPGRALRHGVEASGRRPRPNRPIADERGWDWVGWSRPARACHPLILQPHDGGPIRRGPGRGPEHVPEVPERTECQT